MGPEAEAPQRYLSFTLPSGLPSPAPASPCRAREVGLCLSVRHQLVMGPEPCSPWPRPQEPSLDGTKFVQITSAPVTTRLNCLMGTVCIFF